MRRWILGLTLVVTMAVGSAACSTDPAPGPTAPVKPPKVARLVYGVFGTPEEVASYQAVVDAYNEKASTVQVEMQSWSTSDAMMADIDAALTAAGLEPSDTTTPSTVPSQEVSSAAVDPSETAAALEAADLPDIYMVARRDLAHVVDTGLNVPLFNLLEDRNVSYGDGYARDALEAFSDEADLQCMPYSVSPMVIYINTDLVDFAKMRARGLLAPAVELTSWTIEEFRAAAQFATRPKLHTKGASIAPSLRSIAPFLYSGGGQIFNDPSDPVSLDLSSDDNRQTLTTLLEVARNPRFTLTDAQLEQAPPTDWFKRGRLGMVEGFRSLTPELRGVAGLHFDVMPMPRIDEDATVGDISGICIAPGANIQRAADFLVYAISAEGFAPVTQAGYIVPANLAVARSAAFLQPDQQPAHAGTFNAGVDNMVLTPLLENYDELDAAIDPFLRRAFTEPLLDGIDVLTAEIDEASRLVLDPTYVPSDPSSESPSDPASPSTGTSTTGSTPDSSSSPSSPSASP